MYVCMYALSIAFVINLLKSSLTNLLIFLAQERTLYDVLDGFDWSITQPSHPGYSNHRTLEPSGNTLDQIIHRQIFLFSHIFYTDPQIESSKNFSKKLFAGLHKEYAKKNIQLIWVDCSPASMVWSPIPPFYYSSYIKSNLTFISF